MNRFRSNRMKEARFLAKLNQMDLWLDAGIHYSTISRIERGYVKPTKNQKQRLAQALGLRPAGYFHPEI